MNLKSKPKIYQQLITTSLLVLLSYASFAQDLDPQFNYFIDGLTIGNRSFQLGDNDNWSTSIDTYPKSSESGKITVQQESYKGENDAINIIWSKQEKRGQLSLYGPNTDLSTVKDLAALAFDLKINSKFKGKAFVGLDCGYPCRAEVRVDKQMRRQNLKEWTVFPIPLNCFEGEEFDLSKVNGPFYIASEGRGDISIANIRILLLPEGEKGCAK